jgi:uncharacterized protein (TIGR02453 family)
MSAFNGFSEDTLQFVAELRLNNEKAWFDQNRERYEAAWLEPAKLFVVALGEKLKKLSKGVQYAPKVNGSIMRINRDTRFSKDKQPYKTHLDLWFWEGADKGWQSSGFWFRLTPLGLILGAGIHDFEPPLLANYRKAVADPKSGASLEKAITAVEKKGFKAGGEHYKRVPKGFESDHPRAELLKHAGLYAGRETKPPRELKSARFVDYCAELYRGTLPVHEWLVKLTK